MPGTPEDRHLWTATSATCSFTNHDECIAMDIVGPLPCSQKGNQYTLVICDYATRFPEAVSLCSIDIESMAEELITEQHMIVNYNPMMRSTSISSHLLLAQCQGPYRVLH